MKMKKDKKIKTNKPISYKQLLKNFSVSYKLAPPIERIKKVKKIHKLSKEEYEQLIGKINFNNISEQALWQLRLKILELILKGLHTINKIRASKIPIKSIALKDRTEYDSDKIFNRIRNEEGFFDWYKDRENYYVEYANKTALQYEYNLALDIVSKFNSGNKVIKSLSEQLSQEINKKSRNQSSTSIENNVGFLLIEKEKIEIGSAKNIPFKLLEALCPFGKANSVNALFNMTTTERSKYKKNELSFTQKADVLRTRIKDLQDILKRSKKIKVRLIFNKKTETVFMKYKLK